MSHYDRDAFYQETYDMSLKAEKKFLVDRLDTLNLDTLRLVNEVIGSPIFYSTLISPYWGKVRKEK